eukprot:TRINITY_DN55676_c0_g1_i1.p1 TRINITY_DN55676_c0_g1~~TRINITY_DN55676_c0_g1_i1.p1  ORF type:complete len:751 (+),score=140.62 TRINITY_DN55676_c0_g1_i1:199-2451(+)
MTFGDRRREIPSQTFRPLVPQPHKWGREAPVLPSQVLEKDFSRKVREHLLVRQQQPRPCEQTEEQTEHVSADEGMDGDKVATQAGEAKGLLVPLRSGGSRHGKGKPCSATVEPKYLLHALIPAFGTRLFSRARGSVRNSVRQVSAHTTELDDGFHPRMGSAATSSRQTIMEASTSVTIQTETGRARIPPHHWIVVDNIPSTRSLFREGGGNGAALDVDDTHDLYSSASCGGGDILKEDAALLRPVPESRLHYVAAEANFKRASLGSSILALRHAACCMEIVARYEAERQSKHLPSLPPSATTSSTSILDDISTRLQRHEVIVASQAAASEQRLATARANVQPPSLPSLVELATDGGILRKRLTLKKGFLALVELLEFAKHRYGNSVRLWFALDPEENMKLGEKVFIRRCVDIGFRGNIPAMWKYTDGDSSGNVSLLELDASAATMLAGFKVSVEETFNGNFEDAFNAIDINKTGRIRRQEFVAGLRSLGIARHDPSRLFDLLDRQGFGYVVRTDLRFLSRWKTQRYLFSAPATESLKTFKEVCISVFGLPLFKCWRKVLDRNARMRISYEDFCSGCKQFALRTRQKQSLLIADMIPLQEEQLAGVWRALDDDCSGWVALREFDPESHEVLAEFKRWCERIHGSAVKAFRNLDGNSNGKMVLSELQGIGSGKNPFKGNPSLLFSCLDVSGEGKISIDDVSFLDSWDLTFEEWESEVLATHNVTARFGHLKRYVPSLADEPGAKTCAATSTT